MTRAFVRTVAATALGLSTLVPAGAVAVGDAATPQWRTTVPAGFHLGLPPMHGSEFEREGPGRHLDIELEACHTVLWPAGARTDNLAVRILGPEFARIRQVAVYQDNAAAKAAFADLLEAKRGCTIQHHGHQMGTRWRFKQHDLGADSLFGSAQSRWHGRPTIGLSLFRWVRVGNAIGYTFESGEGMLSSPHSTRGANRDVRDLRQRMCVFRVSRCR